MHVCAVPFLRVVLHIINSLSELAADTSALVCILFMVFKFTFSSGLAKSNFNGNGVDTGYPCLQMESGVLEVTTHHIAIHATGRLGADGQRDLLVPRLGDRDDEKCLIL